MSRRFFIKILIALGLGNFFPKIAAAEEIHMPKDGYEPLNSIKFLRQIITKDSRTSRMIMWQSDSAEDFLLEYKAVGEESAHFAEVERRDFIYSCALEGLKPESLYKFRIISGELATPWHDLRTSGDGEFQMIIFADSQCEHYEIWRRTADIAAENYPDAEIFLVNGDLVDNGEANYQWRAFFDASTKLLDKIFVPVMGNHECYGVDWFNALPTGYLNQFILPNNGAKNFDGYFYSFDYGAAHFFILNTQFLELNKFKPKLRETQEYFLKRDAAQVNRPWKIVFMHKDIYDYAQDKFNDLAEVFMDLFAELEIDLVFTGHLHTYRNRGKLYFRQKSARGATYILCGRSGDQKYVEPHSDIDKVTYKNLETEPESYIVLKIRTEEITLTAQAVDGEILDKFTLRKG